MSKSNKYLRERKKRIDELVAWLGANDFHAAVFLKEDIELFAGNYFYYGGPALSGEYGALIIEASGDCAAIAHEYSFQRVQSLGDYSKVVGIRQSAEELVNALRTIVRSKKIAIDTGATVALLDLIKSSSINPRKNSLREFVFDQRSIKSDYEISEMESAIRLARLAFEKMVNALEPGLVIEDITRMLNIAMLEEGAAGASFGTDIRIRRDMREEEVNKLQRGDLLLFDYGARVDSMYLSDIGRTIPFGGKISQKESDFLSDVCSIKREGIKRISSGKSGNLVREEIDSLIGEYGFTSTHRPGHQIGLNVHEPYGPNLNYGVENSEKLNVGNVVTWEPGIGIPNKELPSNRFGMAHMEDMVLVQRGRSRALGNLPLEYW